MVKKVGSTYTPDRLIHRKIRYIFSESLKNVDYEGIFNNIKKIQVFQIYRSISQCTDVHQSSSFPVRFEREDTINIAMSSGHLSLKNVVGKF